MQHALPTAVYDPSCRRCARLARFLDEVGAAHPDYHAAPVPPFGSNDARLLVVGLAPGMHGANASGRPFTGDHAGILLYRTLHRFGFAARPESRHADDGLRLPDCRITNAVKCLPPQNKPQPAEIANCRSYLAAELALLAPGAVVVALGRIAHETLLRAWGLPLRAHPFAHGAEHVLEDAAVTLLDSYHCSRYNTQTGRLTAGMFEAVFARARALLDGASS
ncbi:MAG: uracil-DNA glycosylase [Gammaproteobacteria bacterium]